MTVHWLQPLAWWGLGLLALPIVIHLLARHRSRRLLFPSIRFLPDARMAALRRRALADWPLLVVRLLILAAAVAAFASPVFVSDERRDAWDRRVARAIVVASPQTQDIEALAAEESSASYASAEFAAASVPDGIRDAERWLDGQPAAAREIVVLGDLREGMLAAPDLTRLPASVGLRFLPVVQADDGGAVRWSVVADGADGSPVTYAVSAVAEETETRVRYEESGGIAAVPVRIAAAPADQPYAEAVLRAVLREGLLFGGAADRAVTIAFAGADLPEFESLAVPEQPWMRRALEHLPGARGGVANGVLVIRPQMAVRDVDAPRLVADALRAAFEESRVDLEPRRVSAATLAAWSRASGGAPPDARPADEGDRRWFWAAALALLAVEHTMRRRRRAA